MLYLPKQDPSPSQLYLVQLRHLLVQHFNLEELRTLCFDLAIEFEELLLYIFALAEKPAQIKLYLKSRLIFQFGFLGIELPQITT
ncbi:MAG TPA: hypothetical protein P5280_12830 [Cyclobacteriaceae bacterium]|nr:hypothetical protein [Cyclobacteriaceae bacterium]